MNPEGCIFKSSKDVERKLEADGILDQFVKENSPEIFDKQASTSEATEDSDEDYEPPVKKKAAECLDESEKVLCFSSPVCSKGLCLHFHQ